MPEPYVRMIERRFPRAGLERALLRAGLRRRHRAQAVFADLVASPEPIEDLLAAPEPTPAPLPADDWCEEALLETYERGDPEDDYNDEFADESDLADEGDGVLAGTGQPPSTNAAGTGHAPQLRKEWPAVNVAEPDASATGARGAGGPSPTSIEVIRPAPLADYSRFVAAMKAKRRPADPAPAGEPPPALSPEECRRCGIPGFKGCEHQAPYVRPEPLPMKAVGHNGSRPPKSRSASWPWKGEGN